MLRLYWLSEDEQSEIEVADFDAEPESRAEAEREAEALLLEQAGPGNPAAQDAILAGSYHWVEA